MTLNQEAIALLRKMCSGQFGSQRHAPNCNCVLCDLVARIDKEAKEQKRLARYKQAALAGYYESDSVDFDDATFVTVSKGSDPGAYVSCWAWVADIDVKNWRKDNRTPRPKTKTEIIRETAKKQGIPVIEIPLVTDEERSNGPKRG